MAVTPSLSFFRCHFEKNVSVGKCTSPLRELFHIFLYLVNSEINCFSLLAKLLQALFLNILPFLSFQVPALPAVCVPLFKFPARLSLLASSFEDG